MQVAVTGVKNVGHAKPVLLRERRDLPEHLGQSGSGNGAVHAVIVR